MSVVFLTMAIQVISISHEQLNNRFFLLEHQTLSQIHYVQSMMQKNCSYLQMYHIYFIHFNITIFSLPNIVKMITLYTCKQLYMKCPNVEQLFFCLFQLDTFTAVYKKLTGKDVNFEFPEAVL